MTHGDKWRTLDIKRRLPDADRLNRHGFMDTTDTRPVGPEAETPSPSTPSPLLTAEEAAPYLRCTPVRLRALAREGRIGHRQDGRRVYFTLADLDAYVDSCLIPAKGSGRSAKSKGRRGI